jgi:hypothetical protein
MEHAASADERRAWRLAQVLVAGVAAASALSGSGGSGTSTDPSPALPLPTLGLTPPAG